MAIKVENIGLRTCEVAINQWGTGGETGFFKISPNGSDTWIRSDKRGFVMSVHKDGSTNPYYVTAESVVTLDNDKIIIDGKEASPINK